jgi:hypothetical protein
LESAPGGNIKRPINSISGTNKTIKRQDTPQQEMLINARVMQEANNCLGFHGS